MSGGSSKFGKLPQAISDELVLTDAVTPLPAPEPYLEAAEDDEPRRSALGWLLPAVAIVAVLGWLGGMGWLLAPSFRVPVPPAELVQLIAALCVPPALVGILWLLSQRTSSAEARRFGDTARAMRDEAASLERTVAALSRKIEENRAALAGQTTALMAMGDGATERLQAIANGMAHEAKVIDASTRMLGEAAAGAEKSLNVVLASLPKAEETIATLATTLDATGMNAGERASALHAQVVALGERGREADEVTGAAAARLAAHIARMEATSETAGTRLEAVASEMSETVDGMLDRTSQAVDEARKGIAAQGDAMLAMLATNQAALDNTARESVEALGARIEAIEGTIGRIAARLGEEHVRSDLLLTTLSGGIARIDGEFAGLHGRGMERTQALAASLSALGGSADAMGEAMKAGEAIAQGVIRTAEELLTALDSSTREIDETLPDALSRLDARILESRAIVAGAKPELLALVTAAESTHDAIEAIADVVSTQRDTLAKTQESLLETLDSGQDKAEALGGIIDSTIATTRRFADEAAPQLVEALLRVRETATAAADQARATLASIVPETTRVLEQAGTTAMQRAVETSVRSHLTELAETAEAAVHAASLASERLTEQMLTISEVTASVENRIAEAKAEHESADRDNFARRVSLLIEALNSASIDITKSFSHEVSDSAWAAYLKGDRGVFTRRAVRLLDAGQTREIAQLYDADESFREQVNRYIHDFEAMLRQILGLRDGSPLGVTLLSSDMGKLYVALAQAIERLRA
jgi:hypothetical protein